MNMVQQKPRPAPLAPGLRANRAKRFFSVIGRLLKGQGAHIRMDAHQWDTQFAHGKWQYLYATPNLGLVARLVQQQMVVCGKEQPHLLDVGCGNGALPNALASSGIRMRYTGIDVSAEALRQAQEAYPPGTFVQASMEASLPSAGPIDVVVFNEVLYYGDADRTLAAHLAHLAPDGVYIISMYRTLRTRYVWWTVRSYTRGAAWYSVHDATRNVTWDMCIVSAKRK